MSTRDLKLFIEDEIDLKKKFILLMDKLINNQSNELDNFIFLIIFSIQNISIYFPEKIGVLKTSNNTFDKILIYLEKIIRVKSLFFYHKDYYFIIIFLICLYNIFFTILFIYLLFITNRATPYNSAFQIFNYLIKISIYLLSNVTLDFFTHLICFHNEYNKYIPEIKCNQSNNLISFIISFITVLFSQLFIIFIHCFYEDNLYTSESSFSCSCNNLFLFQHLNTIISSFTLSLFNEFHHGFFFLINFSFSAFLFFYYINRFIYYNPVTHLIYGLSFFLNLYTSIYFFFFYYIKMSYKGLIYLISCIFVSVFYIKLQNNILDKIVKKTPYHKLNNRFYLLYYIKFLIDLIEQSNLNPEKRALLIGIMEIHAIECPNQECLTKNKKKIYLPIDNSWSDRSKSFIYDKIFLKTFIVVIINYYLKIDFYTPELVINLSHYYLNVIGNVCLCIYHCKKVNQMNLKLKEKFLLERLKIKIELKLIKSLKDENEAVSDLEDLNTTFYYKYNNITKQFIKEIYKDLDLNIEFWDHFSIKKNPEIIDLNKVIKVIEKINNSKNEIKKLWKKMFEIYSGINIYYLLYLEYIIEINDDTKLKTELERYKKKKENSTENIIINYYNILFSKDTGIAIINGDKGKEGIIEKVNYSFGKIFHCNSSKIKGKYINDFMPNIFSKDHIKAMKNFFDNGKKILINKGNSKIFGLDKNKSILQLEISIKIFPILNDYLYYIGLLTLDKVDDIILIDSNFIIQGMSRKLVKKFQITNDNLFIENEIPFYIICKNFIRFYRTFFNQNKKSIKKKQIRNSFITNSIQPFYHDDHKIVLKDEYDIDISTIEDNKNQQINIENIEDINENMEIEYEIKFPYFLSKYSYITNNLEKELNNHSNISELNSQNENENLSSLNNDSKINKEIDEEDTPLIIRSSRETNNYQNSSFYKNSKLFLRTPVNTPFECSDISFNNQPNIVFYDYGKTKTKQEINYENEGKKKLDLYKNLFKEGRFIELEKNLDRDITNGYIGFKFNFSFEKFFFYENKICFIIRCIENKMDNDENIDLSHVNNPISNYINSNYLFDKLNEINYEEKDKFFLNIQNFQNLTDNNRNLKNIIEDNYKDIKTKSRIYGENNYYNQAQVLNTESASQAGESYNSNLSKLNRIIEARENLLQDVNFYTLKYMSIIPSIFLIGTIFFSNIFCFFIGRLCDELQDVRLINSIVFKIQIQSIRILNTLLDYLSILRFKILNKENNLKFGHDDLNIFINNSKVNVTEWFSLASVYLNYIERYLSKYLKNPDLFWHKFNITYYIELPFNFSEFFPFIISSSLYNAYYLFTIDFYNNFLNLTKDEFETIMYTSYICIDGTNKYILPVIYRSISILLEDFLKYNNRLFYVIKMSLFGFFVFTNIIGIILFIFIILTINHFGIGIQKVYKISQINIKNIISNIENFKTVVKYRFKLDENEERLVKQKTLLTTKTKNKIERGLSNIEEDSNKEIHHEFYEHKKYKNIKIEKFLIIFFISYFGYFCVILIFLFYLPLNLIDNNGNLIKSESYILQQFFYTSIQLYRLKCYFTRIASIEYFDYNQIVNESLSDSLYKTLPKFKTFYNFYYIGFKLDACYSLYIKDSYEYNKCKKEDWPISFNNTESFKEFILRKISILEYEYQYNLNYNKSFSSIEMFDHIEYLKILKAYQLYYINVFQRFEDTIQDVLVNRINNIKKYNLLLCAFLVILPFSILIYSLTALKSYFQRMLLISKSFIQIIPSYVIFNTPSLESWLEKEGKI